MHNSVVLQIMEVCANLDHQSQIFSHKLDELQCASHLNSEKCPSISRKEKVVSQFLITNLSLNHLTPLELLVGFRCFMSS